MAEGSFANKDDKVVVEEGIHNHCTVTVTQDYFFMFAVHLRKRKFEHGQLKAPSTSAITYWQIEKDKEPLSGKHLNALTVKTAY